MKFVVDTNILMTFFWEYSFTRKIFFDKKFEFFSPEYSIWEINSHKLEIMKKAKISPDKFKELKKELIARIKFIPLEEYKNFLIKAAPILDKDDVDFVALGLKLKLPLWSNDRDLKQQSIVPVLTTKELVGFFYLEYY